MGVLKAVNILKGAKLGQGYFEVNFKSVPRIQKGVEYQNSGRPLVMLRGTLFLRE